MRSPKSYFFDPTIMTTRTKAKPTNSPAPAQEDAAVSSQVVLINIDNTEVLAAFRGAQPEADAYELLVDDQFIGFASDAAANTDFDVLLNQNQLVNASFKDGLGPWTLRETDPKPFTVATDFSAEWTLKDGHTAYIYQQGSAVVDGLLTYRDPVDGECLPVRPGAFYQVMGSFGFHRCDGEFIVEFLDPQQRVLHIERVALSGDKLGGESLDNYVGISRTVQAPPAAARVRLSLCKHPTAPGREHSFLFFTRLFWGLRGGRDEPAVWQDYAWDDRQMAMLREVTAARTKLCRLALPDAVYDGQTHAVRVRHRKTGQDVAGSPLPFHFGSRVSGEVEGLDGSVVQGWARLDSTLGVSLQVSLYVDDEYADCQLCTGPHPRGPHGFRIPVPARYLDGRPHRLTVRSHLGGKPVGELAEILPYSITPWDALQRYAGSQVPARLSPAAAYRYQSLVAALKAVDEPGAAARESAELWRRRLPLLGRWHDKLVLGFERNRSFEPLAFPEVEQPLVSIVIPVHNKFPVTYHCLVALLFAYSEALFEVIVVDDGSGDRTTDLPNLAKGIVYVRHDSPQGFVDSCNDGAARARGDYVVFLNNDTEPTAGWLDEMLFVFRNFDGVGLVGAKLLYPDGRLQEAGGIVWGNGDPWNYGRGGNPHDPRFNYTRQADYLSGAAIMLPRALWEEVQGFSEAFRPAYFEDTDLAFKVRAAGRKTVYAPLAVVYHYEGISSGTDVTSGAKRYQEVNRPKFKQKWAGAYRFNGELGKQVDLNKDRGVRYRALVIDYQMPRPDCDAGSYAAIQEMRLLQALGCKVTFLAENLAYVGAYNEQLQRMGVEVVHAPFATSVEQFLEKRGREFDLVYITRYYVARNHLPAVRQFAPGAKVLFCNADLHFLREIREAIHRGDEGAMERAIRIREEELSVMREVDLALSYNTTEHAVIVSHNGADTKVALCPWVVDTVDFVPVFAARADIAFLGGFGHPPNKLAVQFFARQVMPLLRKKLKNVRFLIYGSQASEEIEALRSEAVVVKGFVEHVEQVFNTCRVFVAPLQSGAGIKGKVMDALSYGVPCVLSPVAAEGINLRHGREAMIAETPEQWAEAVAQLYLDHVLWQKVSEHALEFARTFHSFEEGRKLMRKALEAVDIFPPTETEALVFKKARIG
jgi:GT2 family glycosyltransferase/glycosyltransferase involved in cell wall biosynthesis